MKKNFRNLFLFVLIIFFAVTPIYSQSKFSLKLMGGFSTMGGGDLNDAITESHRLYSDYTKEEFIGSFDLDEFRWITDFKGELILHLTSNIGIGIGTEYLSKTNKGTAKLDYSYEETYLYRTYYYEYKLNDDISWSIKAIPILLNLYYFVPIGSRAVISINVGGAYYFGSLEYKDGYDYSRDYSFESATYLDSSDTYSYNGTIEEKTKSGALGFQGGLGLEFYITSNIALVAEISGRVVNFKDWTGDFTNDWSSEETHWVETAGTDTDSDSGKDIETGKFWCYSFNNYDTDNSYKTIGVREDWQDTSGREAEIDLNGFQFRIGISIRI